MCPPEPARAEPAPVLLAMVKAPRPGFVKTRLGAHLGAALAARLYRLMVERQLAVVPRAWAVEVHYAPADAGEELRSWLGPRATYWPQCDGDLGQRLTYAVAGSFTRGAASVIVVGGDCPGLGEAELIRAEEALRSAEVVLGPAVDGGYTLIGLRQPQPRLFAAIEWSTSSVLATTLQRVAELGLRSDLLETREDVDDWPSLQRFLAAPPSGAEVLCSSLRALLPP